MGMSEFCGEADEAESIATIHRALELGVTFLDTADVYGMGQNEQLVGKAIGVMRSCSPRNLATSERAQRVHPIAALQTEYSLWSREPEGKLLDTVRELDIGFVAYSPPAR